MIVDCLARGGDGFDLRGIVDRHHPPQGVRGELFDEGFGETIDVLSEQVLELARAVVRTTVGELAAGVDRRVVPLAAGDLLVGPPTADGVEVVERETERIDLLMA